MPDNQKTPTKSDRKAPDTGTDLYQATEEWAQEAYGKTKEAALAGEDYIRSFIEEQPYTATAIALGIGLVIGYISHQSPPPPPPSKRTFW
jgi:ElaB/YqjD/DUF883 family membrane-anchored ribosome-binding protein